MEQPPVPIRQGRRREASGATGSGIPRPHRTHSASSASKTTTTSDYEKQLETYCRDLEEDHAELRTAYLDQHTQLEAAHTLLKETKLKEDMIQAVDRRVKLTCDFLEEMNTWLTDGRALRPRMNPNDNSSDSKRKRTLSSVNYRRDDIIKMMDTVRDGLQRKIKELQASRDGEEKNLQAARAAEKEVQALKKKLDALQMNAKRPLLAPEDDTICVPASADEMTTRRQQLNIAKRQNEASLQEIRQLNDALKGKTHELDLSKKKISSLETEVNELRFHMEAKDKIIEELKGKSASSGGDHSIAAATTTTSSAPTRKCRPGVTHHYCVLHGKGYRHALQSTEEVFKDTFVKSLATLLKLPESAFTNVTLCAGVEGVSAEFDVKHSKSMEEVDYQLLQHSFVELDVLKQRGEAQAAHEEITNAVSLLQELAKAKASLKTAEDSASTLSGQVRRLEASLERRDAEDAEVESALLDTEMTIQDLYTALEQQSAKVEEQRGALEAYEQKLQSLQAALDEEKEVRKESDALAERKQTLLRSAETKWRSAEKTVLQLQKEKLEQEALLQNEINTLKTTVKDLQENWEVLRAREAALKEALKQEKVTRESLLMESTKKSEVFSENQQKLLTEIKEKLDSLETAFNQVEETLDNALPTSDKKKAVYNTTEAKAKRVVELLRSTDQVLRKENSQKNELETKIKTLETERDRLQQSLSTLDSEREQQGGEAAAKVRSLQLELEKVKKASEREVKELQEAVKAEREKRPPAHW